VTTAPVELVIEQRQEADQKPTAHVWHVKCQGMEPGTKICFCGHKMTVTSSAPWHGKKILAEDCVVCVELHAIPWCPVCNTGKED
jgi:hypothetical protein